MKFYINDEIVTTNTMPLVVVLTDKDKENISNMHPDCNVYCSYDPDIHNPDAVGKMMDEAKQKDKK